MHLTGQGAGYRCAALGATAGSVCVIMLHSYTSSLVILGIVVLDFLGGYAASRLGRRGLLWFFFGLFLFALPFFLLAVLPAGNRAPKVSGRVKPWMLTTGALALCALFALVSARESAFWADAEMGKSIVGYEKYLARWPKGRHVDDARLRIADLERQKARLAAGKTEREAWLKDIRGSKELDSLFSDANSDRGPFRPLYFLIFLDETDLMGYTTIWFRRENLTNKIEEAQTLVFVRTSSREIGRFEYPGGGDAGPATAWTVTFALVDAGDFKRRRVVEAGSASPQRIRGNTSYGGSHTVDGITFDKTENKSSLLHKLLEHVLEQSKGTK
jgi:hypothetical protein